MSEVLDELIRQAALLAECRKLLCAIGGIGYGVTLTEYKRKAMELVGRIDEAAKD